MPLAAYAGQLILDDVVVENGKLAIEIGRVRPEQSARARHAPPPAEPRALALRGLHLHDFAFLYDDRQTPMRIAATGIESALDDSRRGRL